MVVVNDEFLLDTKNTLILLATSTSKTAMEISRECNIPLSTTYRKLNDLVEYNLVKICGNITDGKRYLLYTSNSKMPPFKNSSRALAIINTIKQNPGICFRDVVRISGLANGIVSHYIVKLQKNGLVKVKRGKRKTRYFTKDVSRNEMELTSQLRNDTAHEIVAQLLEYKCLTFPEILGKTSKSPASIAMRLSRLVKSGFVTKSEERHPKYFFKDEKIVSRTMPKVQPLTKMVHDAFVTNHSYKNHKQFTLRKLEQ